MTSAVFAALLIVPLAFGIQPSGTHVKEGGDVRVGSEASTCLVTNARTHVKLRSLQASIDAARSGDQLLVRGRCDGHFRVVRSLRLRGVRTTDGVLATLDATGSGRVLTIVEPNALVRIHDLRITGGRATQGAGIRNIGTLILSGTTSVVGNSAERDGGGVWNGGTLLVRDHASITQNRAIFKYAQGEPLNGGGIYNEGDVRLRDYSSVSRNSASTTGGGLTNRGTVTMMGSASIFHNSSQLAAGGVWNSSGQLTLTGAATVRRNEAHYGGGVINRGAMWMWDSSSVVENRATSAHGGGIVNFTGCSLILEGSSRISRNMADMAGGVYNGGEIHLNGAAVISGNTAVGLGGGVANGGTLRAGGSVSIKGNSAQRGGGVANLAGGRIWLENDVTIRENTASLFGAGIFNWSTSDGAATVDLIGSVMVTGNSAGTSGGGIYNRRESSGVDASITLSDSTSVTGNTAGTSGGGLLNDGGAIYECSELVAISPNEPDDPPATLPCS